MPVCVRARVSISLEAEYLASLSYEVVAMASISKLELSGAISATLSAIHVVHWTWQGESWHHCLSHLTERKNLDCSAFYLPML